MADQRTSTKGQDRPALSRDTIVAAALATADTDGLGKLSMRPLARGLGYEVMSLYNHVDNKDQLLDLMIDAVAAEISAPAGLEPIPTIRGLAASMRSALLRHPWAPDRWQQHRPGPHRIRLMETLLRLLAQSGLSPELAHLGFHAVNNHVLGHTLQQIGLDLPVDDLESVATPFLDTLSAEEHPYMIAHIHEHLNGDTGDSFELVLDLILEGLVRVDRDGRG